MKLLGTWQVKFMSSPSITNLASGVAYVSKLVRKNQRSMGDEPVAQNPEKFQNHARVE